GFSYCGASHRGGACQLYGAHWGISVSAAGVLLIGNGRSWLAETVLAVVSLATAGAAASLEVETSGRGLEAETPGHLQPPAVQIGVELCSSSGSGNLDAATMLQYEQGGADRAPEGRQLWLNTTDKSDAAVVLGEGGVLGGVRREVEYVRIAPKVIKSDDSQME
ncbi:hypothetical protein CYMTET_22748, partial [Cymbomonas tetramitiformis]